MEDNNNNNILLDIDIKNQYDYILYQTNLSYRRINKIEKKTNVNKHMESRYVWKDHRNRFVYTGACSR